MKSWMGFPVVLALLVLSAAAVAQHQPQHRHQKVTGELTAVDPAGITLKVTDKIGEHTATFTTNAKTNVMIETDENEVVTENGPTGNITVRMPKLKQGTFADLQVGQRVSVSSMDEKVATLIQVRRASKK